MANTADRLARLKALKSGLAVKRETSDQTDEAVTSFLDAMEEPPASQPAPQPKAVPAPEPAPKPVPAAETSNPKEADDDTESLSAYFEALGIVPDEAKVAPVLKTPPSPKAAEPDPVPEPEPQPVATKPTAEPKPSADIGRPVDARDRWADPVREDDSFLSSFAGADAAHEDENGPSLDSLLGDFGEDEKQSEATPEPEPEPILEATQAPAAEEVPEAVAAEDDADLPSFGADIDIDAFEREIASKENATQETGDTPEDQDPAPQASKPEIEPLPPELEEGALSVFFDAGRSATLNQVSEQMGCTVDDVVITAVDWYLDALFGEDGSMQDAGAAE